LIIRCLRSDLKLRPPGIAFVNSAYCHGCANVLKKRVVMRPVLIRPKPHTRRPTPCHLRIYSLLKTYLSSVPDDTTWFSPDFWQHPVWRLLILARSPAVATTNDVSSSMPLSITRCGISLSLPPWEDLFSSTLAHNHRWPSDLDMLLKIILDSHYSDRFLLWLKSLISSCYPPLDECRVFGWTACIAHRDRPTPWLSGILLLRIHRSLTSDLLPTEAIACVNRHKMLTFGFICNSSA